MPLAPEAASVGLDIRVVGNDSGEKVSVALRPGSTCACGLLQGGQPAQLMHEPQRQQQRRRSSRIAATSMGRVGVAAPGGAACSGIQELPQM